MTFDREARDRQREEYEAYLGRQAAEERAKLSAVVATAMAQWLHPGTWVRADNDEPLPVSDLAGVAIDALEAHGIVFVRQASWRLRNDFLVVPKDAEIESTAIPGPMNVDTDPCGEAEIGAWK